ncbi:MAG: hypothetical protein EXS16_03850 [Gemmataceae bacterium]|nr:hypothetical protein [Gemmataceae bacterium]
MANSESIDPKSGDFPPPAWESVPERAPSFERDERPTVARILAMMGLFLLVLGSLALLAPTWMKQVEGGPPRTSLISPAWGFFFATIGLCLILYHVYCEQDVQFRRLYAFAGLALILTGVILRVLAFRAAADLTWFMIGGLPSLFIGAIVLTAVIRSETERNVRDLLLNLAGGIGVAIIGFCFYFALRRDTNFLTGEGAILLILGLLFACIYISMQETSSDRGHYAGIALGLVGLLGLGIGIVQSLLNDTFLIPGGLVLIGFSLVYIFFSLGTWCDWPIVILTRRDLAAYFYSPIAYLVFIGTLLIGWFIFLNFVGQIESFGQRGGIPEPIVGIYIFGLFPVIVQLFVVPVLTMRLFSEEKRTATIEVLLTAPVNEVSVVVAKFFACWIFYMLTWVPWWLFLVSLRYFGGQEFDYYPALSFNVALAVISAGLIATGLFFSALTSNQIVAAVLAFVGVLVHLVLYFLKHEDALIRQGGVIHEVISFVNFYDLWNTSLGGLVSPRHLIFHVSVAIFFLFATVKVLESRKWK